MPAILDFKAGLEEIGVELLLVPVPPKATVYPDELDPKIAVGKDAPPPRFDTVHQAFYDTLRKEGVRVLDLAPLFGANRFHKDGPVYCRQDTHWSGVGCALAAKAVAAALADVGRIEGTPKREYDADWREVEITGDLWRDLPEGERPPKERLRLRFVTQGEGGGPVEVDRASPVILMGDSHTLVFHEGADLHARGAGLVDQLAFELGFALELVGTRGSGATPVRLTLYRRPRSTPGYWRGKKWVVWCLSAREFAECGPTGWWKVPVTK
jgi:alginate O-acetyltransferase complex protein AlgJ